MAPDAVAFLHESGDHMVTWRDIAGAAGTWRRRLAPESGGAKVAGDVASETANNVRVGLKVSSPVDFIREYLGALAAGVPIAPLDPRRSEAELLWASATFGLSHILDGDGELIAIGRSRTRARSLQRAGGGRGRAEGAGPMLVGDFPLGGLAEGVGVGRAWHPSVAPLDEPLPTAEVNTIDQPAVVIATKGTTGAFKLVPFTQRQLLIVAARVVSHFRLGDGDRGYVVTDLHSVDAQVMGALAVLLSGGSTVVGSFDRRSFWEVAERAGVTWVDLAPAMVASLVGVPAPVGEVRERLRFARVGGAPLALATHAEFWQATGVSLLETYTLTEAAGPVAINPLPMAGRRPGSVGLPVGVEVRIVDDEGRVLPAGSGGHIQIHGLTVASHYLPYGRKGEWVQPREPSGWLDTGDVGLFTSEGYLYVLGRADDWSSCDDAAFVEGDGCRCTSGQLSQLRLPS
jgi:acyl-CoA synthetase (AMP-forming)/AMP-acid ligase II